MVLPVTSDNFKLSLLTLFDSSSSCVLIVNNAELVQITMAPTPVQTPNFSRPLPSPYLKNSPGSPPAVARQQNAALSEPSVKATTVPTSPLSLSMPIRKQSKCMFDRQDKHQAHFFHQQPDQTRSGNSSAHLPQAVTTLLLHLRLRLELKNL